MRPLLILSVLALAGCKNVKTQGGHVPAEYLAQAKQAAGSYKGTFQGVPTTLVVSFDGDRPRVEVRNNQGNDLLGRACGSSVGLLDAVDLDETSNGKYALRTAYFNFNSNKCRVEGSSLDLSFEGGVISASVLESTDVDPCFIEASAPVARDPDSFPDHCHPTFNRHYLSGQFSR